MGEKCFSEEEWIVKRKREDRRGKVGENGRGKQRLLVGKEYRPRIEEQRSIWIKADKESLKEGKEIVRESRKRMDELKERMEEGIK